MGSPRPYWDPKLCLAWFWRGSWSARLLILWSWHRGQHRYQVPWEHREGSQIVQRGDPGVEA